jgi:hypothetical protein
MGKLISLKLYGDVDTGFAAGLEIGWAGRRPDVEENSRLPPPTELLDCLQRWQVAYRALGQAHRIIKPKTVVVENSLVVRKRDCQQRSKQLQQAIDRWLKSPSFAPIREKWLAQVSPTEPACAMIRTADANLWQLPWQQWELLSRYPQLELGFSTLTYENLIVHDDIDDPKGMQILAILGNSEGIDVERDRQLLQQLPTTKTQFLVEPPRQELSQHLWNQPWNISTCKFFVD